MEIDSKTFLAAVSKCATIATDRYKPILRCLLINAKADKCTVTGTNLECGLRISIGCRGDFEAAIPADKLRAILNLCDGQVELLVNGVSVDIVCGHKQWNLPTESVSDFPAMSKKPSGASRTVPAAWFASMSRSVIAAADDASQRLMLGGLRIDANKDSVSLIGLDGCRMYWATLTQPGPEMEGSIPSREATAMIRALPTEGDVEIALTENIAFVSCGNVEFWSRLLEGRFPRWREIVPSPGFEIAIPSSLFNELIDSALSVADTEDRRVSLSVGGGYISSSSKSEFGSSDAKVPIACDKSCACDIRGVYVKDYARQLSGDEVTLGFVGDGDKLIMRSGQFHGLIQCLS